MGLAVSKLLIHATLKLWMPATVEVILAEKVDLVLPDNKMALTTRLSPHRRIERHFFTTLNEAPCRPGPRIKVDRQLITAAARASHDDRPREAANDEDSITGLSHQPSGLIATIDVCL